MIGAMGLCLPHWTLFGYQKSEQWLGLIDLLGRTLVRIMPKDLVFTYPTSRAARGIFVGFKHLCDPSVKILKHKGPLSSSIRIGHVAFTEGTSSSVNAYECGINDAARSST